MKTYLAYGYDQDIDIYDVYAIGPDLDAVLNASKDHYADWLQAGQSDLQTFVIAICDMLIEDFNYIASYNEDNREWHGDNEIYQNIVNEIHWNDDTEKIYEMPGDCIASSIRDTVHENDNLVDNLDDSDYLFCYDGFADDCKRFVELEFANLQTSCH